MVNLELNEKGRGKFFIAENGEQLGEMEVAITGKNLIAYHTEVQPKAEGKGYAKQLLGAMVDHARAQLKQKRGGGAHHVALEEALTIANERGEDLVALDEALSRLGEFDDRKSKVVELRFFGGLSVEETAEVLHVSPVTVMREWSMAKAWLHRELSNEY